MAAAAKEGMLSISCLYTEYGRYLAIRNEIQDDWSYEHYNHPTAKYDIVASG